jgi:hypothetical protein
MTTNSPVGLHLSSLIVFINLLMSSYLLSFQVRFEDDCVKEWGRGKNIFLPLGHFFFFAEVRGMCHKQFCLFWLPRAVDFMVSCSQIPHRAYARIRTQTLWLRVRRPNHSAMTLHWGIPHWIYISETFFLSYLFLRSGHTVVGREGPIYV